MVEIDNFGNKKYCYKGNNKFFKRKNVSLYC